MIDRLVVLVFVIGLIASHVAVFIAGVLVGLWLPPQEMKKV